MLICFATPQPEDLGGFLIYFHIFRKPDYFRAVIDTTNNAVGFSPALKGNNFFFFQLALELP